MRGFGQSKAAVHMGEKLLRLGQVAIAIGDALEQIGGKKGVVKLLKPINGRLELRQCLRILLAFKHEHKADGHRQKCLVIGILTLLDSLSRDQR